jgi:hypothetical protein
MRNGLALIPALYFFLNSTQSLEYLASYAPLFDSTWAQEHPGMLPYSECFIGKQHRFNLGQAILNPFLSYPSPAILGHSYGVIFGKTDVRTSSERIFLSCVSDELGLAYSIPLAMGNIFSVGKIGLSTDIFRFDLKPKSLDGKRFKDLMGSYSGIETRLNLVVTGRSRGKYKNKAGIKITSTGYTPIGTGEVTLSWSKFKIKPRTAPLLPYQEGDYFITLQTTRVDRPWEEREKIVPESLEQLIFVRDSGTD